MHRGFCCFFPPVKYFFNKQSLICPLLVFHFEMNSMCEFYLEPVFKVSNPLHPCPLFLPNNLEKVTGIWGKSHPY